MPNTASEAKYRFGREPEVLRRASRGLSNRGLADELFTSAGTVKRHVSHTHRKPGVHSRTQPVGRARAFRILTWRHLAERD